MSNEFKTFRDTETGKTAKYPARFADLFPSLVEIDPSDAGCLDCLVVSEPDTDVPLDDFVPDEVFYDETEEDD